MPTQLRTTQVIPHQDGSCTLRGVNIFDRDVEMRLPVSSIRVLRWMCGDDKHLIQVSFPELTVEQREFMLTGLDQEAWDNMIDVDDEEAAT